MKIATCNLRVGSVFEASLIKDDPIKIGLRSVSFDVVVGSGELTIKEIRLLPEKHKFSYLPEGVVLPPYACSIAYAKNCIEGEALVQEIIAVDQEGKTWTGKLITDQRYPLRNMPVAFKNPDTDLVYRN